MLRELMDALRLLVRYLVLCVVFLAAGTLWMWVLIMVLR